MGTNAKDKYLCKELNGKRLNEGEDTVLFIGSRNRQGNLPSYFKVSAMAPENGWLLQSLTSGIEFLRNGAFIPPLTACLDSPYDRAQRDKRSSNDEKFQKSTEWYMLYR